MTKFFIAKTPYVHINALTVKITKSYSRRLGKAWNCCFLSDNTKLEQGKHVEWSGKVNVMTTIDYGAAIF
ncbi:hypothetical protein GCM10009001_25290 [Virgibacillus siamensis]|uniref:Uncharacterized protein n=1 Tax=Virgibacillus siamensis TaxID=480071 RepID=A0ABN1G9Y1_9BACI